MMIIWLIYLLNQQVPLITKKAWWRQEAVHKNSAGLGNWSNLGTILFEQHTHFFFFFLPQLLLSLYFLHFKFKSLSGGHAFSS